MYDYYLGGAHNFDVDRAAADQVLAIVPETRTFARENRSFLQRAVRYLVGEAGIDQFLDLGSGIPTVGNVHEIAQAANPDARVVYVDHEPVAVAASRRLLADNPLATIVQADLRESAKILADPDTVRLLDFSRPVAVLMMSVLPFVPESDDPVGIVAGYRNACADGSYLALSHGLTVDYWPGGTQGAVAVYQNTTHPLHPRTPEQIRALFGDLPLIDPGLVLTSAWRPEHPITDERAKESRGMAGVGVINRSG
jgi:hypothetical protein